VFVLCMKWVNLEGDWRWIIASVHEWEKWWKQQARTEIKRVKTLLHLLLDDMAEDEASASIDPALPIFA